MIIGLFQLQINAKNCSTSMLNVKCENIKKENLELKRRLMSFQIIRNEQKEIASAFAHRKVYLKKCAQVIEGLNSFEN